MTSVLMWMLTHLTVRFSQSRRSLVLLRSPSRLPLSGPRSLASPSSLAPVSRPAYAIPGQREGG